MKVFGEHESNVLQQLQNCMDVEEGSLGVLCADGHLGYSQPIGGAVAYREHISPSGVGYDIGCFAGDTKVSLLDGSSPTLRELCLRNEEFWVYSYDEDSKQVVPGKATALQTRADSSLVCIELDEGQKITCTPDHLFLLRSGEYREAQDLRPNESLMPLYHWYDDDGYEMVHAGTRRQYTHKLVDEFFHGDKPKGLVVHHLDHNRLNNDPKNLERWTVGRHASYHAVKRDYLRTEDFKEKRLATLRENGFYAPELLDKKQAIARENGKKFTSEMAKESGNGQRGKQYLLEHNRTAHSKIYVCDKCGAEILGPSNLNWHRRKVHEYNHSIVSITPLTKRSEVYCLQVEGFHNFALDAGVFVHNCGNKAVMTNLELSDFENGEVARVMDEIVRRISFGMGRHNEERVDHPVIDKIRDAPFTPQRGLLELGRKQLGTVGAGNHYVDLFKDEKDRIWIGVHFGSRGFGHKTASGFLAMAQGKDFGGHANEGEMMSPPVVFPIDSTLGQSYIEAMTLAGEYAYAGRDLVCEKVLEILGAESIDEVHNHHNFAWLEEHNGENLWVVRKGCTPAFPGQKGFVGATMGEDAVILEGTGVARSEGALYSTVHGAGRAMSRTKAAGKIKRRKVWECADRNCTRTFQIDGVSSHNAAPKSGICPDHPNSGVRKTWRTEVKSKGLINFELVQQDLATRGIELRGGAADEAPGAYKRLDEVLAAHGDTVRVLHRLTPIGVAMAGAGTLDLYKDG